ncbi:hypothetical protein RF11_02124 [Thelohanellus kitauei]|uniref:Uncharacterized protein n=1 Tax=Thelohanellus kitauei TaxID=669202 RepID=A0A0C2MT36_THEKT|nr:hypothetical protein RF11_02124 [Thelohanellus kitauei]
MVLRNLSKIWSCILNGSRNIFKIDTIDKLIIFATLFSMDIGAKLLKVFHGSVNFELTKYAKQKLFIIYLLLVAYPIVDEEDNAWLWVVIRDLHTSFIMLFDKYSIEDLPSQDQFLIIQFYIKIITVLKVEISSHIYEVLRSFFKRLYTHESLSNMF